MQIAELFVKLGLNVDDQKLGTFQNKLKTTKTNMLKFVAIAGTMAFAIERIANSTIKATVALTNFNMQTGLSVQKLLQWQKVAQLADVTLSAEQITQSIAGLQQNLAQIRLGAGNVAPFQLLGIDVAGKNAFQVLEDVRGAIKGLDAATATNLIAQMGLSPQFVNVLRMTREEFEAINKEFFLNQKQQASIVKLGTSFKKLQLQLGFLRDNIVAQFAPVLIKLLTTISKWFSKNGKSVIKDLGKIVKVFVKIGQVLSNSAGMIFKVIDGLMNMKGVIKALIPIITALGVAFFRPQLAITALLLLLDDLAVFMRGGDSLIGRGLEALGKITQKHPLLSGAINAGVGGLKKVFGIDTNTTETVMDVGGLPPLPSVAMSPSSSTSNTVNNDIKIQSTAPAFELIDELNEKYSNVDLQINNGYVN